jgi:hypothetical protein
MLQTTILVFLLLVPMLASNASAQTIYGCVRNNTGALRIVGESVQCAYRSETPISWNQQGPQGPQGEPGEPGVPGTPGSDAKVLHVFDATGADIGIYAGSDASEELEGVPWRYRIFLPNSEILLSVFGIDGIQKREDVWFYYESADCTGTIYAREAGRLIRTVTVVNFADLYIAVGTEAAVIQPHSKSWRYPLPDIYNCVTQTGVTVTAAPATVIDPATDLGFSFPLPAPLYVGLPPK